jgi:integrase
VPTKVSPATSILLLTALSNQFVAQGQQWGWWHPFRRGLATNLHRLGVDDKTIQVLLRHSSVQTTREIYIKSVAADTIAAMERLQDAIKNKPNRPN